MEELRVARTTVTAGVWLTAETAEENSMLAENP